MRHSVSVAHATQGFVSSEAFFPYHLFDPTFSVFIIYQHLFLFLLLSFNINHAANPDSPLFGQTFS
jgi:hypothetical protein